MVYLSENKSLISSSRLACSVKNSAADTFVIFFLVFPRKKVFYISCKLSPEEIICINSHSFPEKKNQLVNFSRVVMDKILQFGFRVCMGSNLY